MIVNKEIFTKEWNIAKEKGKQFIVVFSSANEGLIVPQDLLENGEIAFNLSPKAIKYLKVNEFNVKFGITIQGKYYCMDLPMHSIIDMYEIEAGK